MAADGVGLGGCSMGAFATTGVGEVADLTIGFGDWSEGAFGGAGMAADSVGLGEGSVGALTSTGPGKETDLTEGFGNCSE